MRVLNLSPGFEPYKDTKMEPIEFETFIFNGGEPHLKIDTTEFPVFRDDEENDEDVMITTRLTTSNDVILLGLARDALNNLGLFSHYELFISYFPAARQDRYMQPGEPLSARLYTDFINSMEFDNVIIFDPHSDVVPALLSNCEVVDNHEFATQVIKDILG